MARLRSMSMLLSCVLAAFCFAFPAWAREYHGQVFFGGVPVPGAVVTVTQGDKQFSAVTDRQGLYEFPDIPDGQWKIEIAMSGFATVNDAVTVGPDTPQGKWDLNLLGLEQMMAQAQVAAQLKARVETTTQTPSSDEKRKADEAAATPPPMPADQAAEQSADGMLVNGSQNNAATSQYSLNPAFGNHRPGQKGQYNGGVGIIADTSALDARPYSLTGEQTPKEFYSRITGIASLGGPLRIPHLMPVGPNFFLTYQWTRSSVAASQTGLVPDVAERSGDLAGLTNALGQPLTIYNPATGLPFTGNVPVSTQAAALLMLYPLPNASGHTRYNYQSTVLNSTHIDAMQSRLMKTFGRRDQFYGGFGFMSQRDNTKSLFGFVDTTNSLGIDGNVNWSHRYLHQTFVLMTYHLTRLRTQNQPQFEGVANISGLAGINGNNQDPQNWGPPSLMFSSGISGLGDANSAFDRNRTDAVNVNVSTNYRRHNFIFGGDFRRQEFNVYSQQNPRGEFTFTGAATQIGGGTAGAASTITGSDFADFLLGIPDASAISFGNPDKYFRQSVYDLYFTDDWRLLPQLTINAGARWDYGAPMTELKNRLANIDVAQGFATIAPVLASSPKGPVSGIDYPTSLVQPDRTGFAPRIGISWRPIPASTLVVRAGYGIYYDSSIYLSAAEAMATQAPFATSLSQSNDSTCRLTLANGFTPCVNSASDTFGVDPNLRVGYAQLWQSSVQRDLPWALVGSVTYFGAKGTHGMQEFLPNTYPIGAVNPCPTCQVGFVYRTSGGNSTRNAMQVQLRRRLRSGLTATFDYTWAKAMDDDAQVGSAGHQSTTNATSPFGVSATNTAGGGPLVAQNWRDLRAERSLSTFDQRHLMNATLQYTTGMGLGRELMSGWRGRILKEWTVANTFSFGTGFPETPTYLAAVPGTSYTSTIRPNVTGAPIYTGTSGQFLNPAAYTAPRAGAWGTAGRNSIEGPDTFSLNSSMSRTFRTVKNSNLDVRLDATNILNRGVFSSWNSVVNSTTFGLPASVKPMRSVQITARMRF